MEGPDERMGRMRYEEDAEIGLCVLSFFSFFLRVKPLYGAATIL